MSNIYEYFDFCKEFFVKIYEKEDLEKEIDEFINSEDVDDFLRIFWKEGFSPTETVNFLLNSFKLCKLVYKLIIK